MGLKGEVESPLLGIEEYDRRLCGGVPCLTPEATPNSLGDVILSLYGRKKDLKRLDFEWILNDVHGFGHETEPFR